MKLPGNKRRLRMVIPIRIIRTMMIHPLMSKKENGQLFRSFFRLILRVCLLYSFWKIKAKKSRKTRLASHTLNSQYCPSPSQQMIPMRRIFSPATSQTTPAVMSKVLLETPYFISEPFYFPENEECQWRKEYWQADYQSKGMWNRFDVNIHIHPIEAGN